MTIGRLPWTISGLSPGNNAPGVVGAGISGLQEFGKCSIEAEIQGATGDTLNLIVQTSYDGKHVSDATKRWFDLAAFAQLAAAQALTKFLITVLRGPTGAAPQALTQGTLAAGTVLQNLLGDALRLWAVPGPATSGGALQVLNLELFGSP